MAKAARAKCYWRLHLIPLLWPLAGYCPCLPGCRDRGLDEIEKGGEMRHSFCTGGVGIDQVLAGEMLMD